ncbi:hypothetical protein DSM19430T_27140 [Desulfovibrio psychrotolerans]|uniref:Uncharacterized protein n=1 Tax=Desulfovibrio psychrotolerans TaxID=415242 RepID=A0A7J0BWE0_9BACT|nr:hypothetical protein DSM19430T_27140 [Desulfovibrio psychrotolerans]
MFKDLISERAVRSLATSILTAAIIAGVDATFFKPEMADAADKATTIGDHISNVVADLPGAIQQGVVHGTISGAVDTAINGGDLGQNLLGSIQGAIVSEIGASAATEIGAAHHNGNINKAAQYIAHAALGGAMDLALGGDGASGAVGAVVGEAVGEMLYSSKETEVTDFAKRVIEGRTDQLQRDQMAQSLQKFKADGVNISALVSGIAAALLGKDVNIASMTGANAAENNALATIAALLCVVFAAYATVEGGGDVVAGIRRIGAGDDTASKLVESGLLAAGELAYEVAPEQTEWVLSQLSVLGAGADAIVTYVDDKTGNTVSAYWSSLSEDDRNLIKGLGVGASFVVGNANCGSLFQKVGSKFASSKALTTASKLEDAAEALGEVAVVSAGKASATVVDLAETGIQWGKGIQGQGMPFENYIASLLPAETRLPANFKTFDFFDVETGLATSVKTLDTATAAKIANPSQVYYSLKSNVDAAANFSYARMLEAEVKAAQIVARELKVAIPDNTTPAQWMEINKAIQYGQSKGVTVMITVVK